MIDQLVNSTYRQAEVYYTLAQDELRKPKDDVVPYSVCQNAFHGIKNYLAGFIVSRGSPVGAEDPKIHDLLGQCRSIDAEFDDLHLAPLYDPTKTEDVWMNLDTAEDFISMLESTRQLVIQRSNIS